MSRAGSCIDWARKGRLFGNESPCLWSWSCASQDLTAKNYFDRSQLVSLRRLSESCCLIERTVYCRFCFWRTPGSTKKRKKMTRSLQSRSVKRRFAPRKNKKTSWLRLKHFASAIGLIIACRSYSLCNASTSGLLTNDFFPFQGLLWASFVSNAL